MKKKMVLLLMICIFLLLPLNVSADKALVSSIHITEEKTIAYDKKELLAALYEADIASVREALDLRLITCRELTEYYLQRIEEYNSTFNCFITLCDNALAEADKKDSELAAGTANGSLFGIPVAVKDNIEYEGFYTTNGQKFADSKISEVNATIVQYLLDEGAIIIGKSNMSTEAQCARRSHSKAVGETYNAYNTELASGGSSGGSAVATSLNFVMASLGTDTNSSLRYPAAVNGCVSLRPTFGLVEKEGCIVLNRRRDVSGAITRTVLDQAIMLDAITGGKMNYTDNLNSNILEGMRIGVLKELCYAVSYVSNRKASVLDDEIQTAFANAIEEFKACGVEIVEVSMPDIVDISGKCSEDRNGWKNTKENFYLAFERLLADNNISAVIFPTYLSSPLYTGISSDGGLMVYDQTWTSNCSVIASPLGLPEISVPIGQHSRGAGIGLEIVSLRNSEQLLLDIAYSYTERYNHRSVPQTAPDINEEYRVGELATFLDLYKKTKEEAERLIEEESAGQETTTPEETTIQEETTTPFETMTETESDSSIENTDNTSDLSDRQTTQDVMSEEIFKTDNNLVKMIAAAAGIVFTLCIVIFVIDRIRVFRASKRKYQKRKLNK